MAKSKLIPFGWELPVEFEARLGDRPGRQRVMNSEGHLLFVLHEPPEPNESIRKPRLFWRKPDGSWHSTGKGNGLAAFRNHLQEFVAATERCDLMEDDAQSAKDYFSVLEAVAPLNRAAENLHLVLEEARKLVPSDRDIINLRDQAYDISRTADLLYGATKHGMEMAQTRRAEEQAASSMAMAKSAHRLNQLVAFFFPLATLATVFGMQLGSGLEQSNAPVPFLVICGIGIVAGLVTTLVLARSGK